MGEGLSESGRRRRRRRKRPKERKLEGGDEREKGERNKIRKSHTNLSAARTDVREKLKDQSASCMYLPSTQPPTVVCKMEAQLEYVHIAYTSLHVWPQFVQYSQSVLIKKSASELSRKIIGWDAGVTPKSLPMVGYVGGWGGAFGARCSLVGCQSHS